MSTTVVRGRAIGIVVRIGQHTEVKKKNHKPILSLTLDNN